MKIHHVVAATVFLACVLASAFITSGAVAIAVVGAGVFVAALFVLHPTIDAMTHRKVSGELNLSATTGVTVKWEVLSDQPIRTVFPENPTDTTNNEEARQLTQDGRAIVRSKNTQGDVDLSTAFEKFRAAANLDRGYWEPRVNIAQILLLTGNLKDAFAEAGSIRVAYEEIPLAYAKAGLIMARVIEQGISEEDTEEDRKGKYHMAQGILQQNLMKCPGHVTSMTSLGRTMLLAGADTQQMREYLNEAIQYREFAEEFRKALDREEMLDAFSSQFPEFVQDDEKSKTSLKSKELEKNGQ